MQPAVTGLALIGRSYPGESYKALTAAFLSRRVEKRVRRLPNAWRTPSDAVVLPKRLFH